MKVSVYNRELERVLILENNYISLLWEETYNEGAKFTLELQYSALLSSKIQMGYFIVRADTKAVMVVDSINIENNIMILSGSSAAKDLDKIGFVGTIESGKNVFVAINTAYNETRKNNIIDIVSTDISDIYSHDISHKSIYELILEICQTTDVGFKAIKSNDKINVQLYKPVALANNIVSDMFGNISDIQYNFSDNEFKNYALILGSGEGESRITTFLDETNGKERYDLIVDAKDMERNTEEGETLEHYISRLKDRGHEKLLEHKAIFGFDCAPMLQEFGVKYGVGDILTIVVNSYDLKFNSRIIKSTEKNQSNQNEITIEIGQKDLI